MRTEFAIHDFTWDAKKRIDKSTKCVYGKDPEQLTYVTKENFK